MWVGTYTMFKDTVCGNLIKIDPTKGSNEISYKG